MHLKENPEDVPAASQGAGARGRRTERLLAQENAEISKTAVAADVPRSGIPNTLLRRPSLRSLRSFAASPGGAASGEGKAESRKQRGEVVVHAVFRLPCLISFLDKGEGRRRDGFLPQENAKISKREPTKLNSARRDAMNRCRKEKCADSRPRLEFGQFLALVSPMDNRHLEKPRSGGRP